LVIGAGGALLVLAILLVVIVGPIVLRPARFTTPAPVSADPESLLVRTDDVGAKWLRNPKSTTDSFNSFQFLPEAGHVRGAQVLLNPLQENGRIDSWAVEYTSLGAAEQAFREASSTYHGGRFIGIVGKPQVDGGQVHETAGGVEGLGRDALRLRAGSTEVLLWRYENVLQAIEVEPPAAADILKLAMIQQRREIATGS
jgi:hypothetical protein